MNDSGSELGKAHRAHDFALRNEKDELRSMKKNGFWVIWSLFWVVWSMAADSLLNTVVGCIHLALLMVFNYFLFKAWSGWRFHKWARELIEKKSL